MFSQCVNGGKYRCMCFVLWCEEKHRLNPADDRGTMLSLSAFHQCNNQSDDVKPLTALKTNIKSFKLKLN